MIASSNLPFHRRVALVMVFLLSFQAAFPTVGWALTSGPAQPEFTSFEPVGTPQMVDLFSGDFVYNIPLFELPGPDGGYPFNLAYHSGIGMDQEASWVGLGWTLNSGAINRIMRGLPDDFNGVEVQRKTDMKPNRTWTYSGDAHLEFWGFKKTEAGEIGNAAIKLNLGRQIAHNNYRGWSTGIRAGLSWESRVKDKFAYGAGFDLGINSQEGATLQPSVSITSIKGEIDQSLSISSGFNSRDGRSNLGLGYSLAAAQSEPTDDDSTQDQGESKSRSRKGGRLGGNYSYNRVAYTPQVSDAFHGLNFSANVALGGWSGVFNLGGNATIRYDEQYLAKRNVWTSAPAYGFLYSKDRWATDMEKDALLDFNREKDGPIRSSTSNLATPISTPDVYNVVGQGIGASYRAYRSDVGIFTDPSVKSFTGGSSGGPEFGIGNGFDLGGNIGGNWSVSQSSEWPSDFEDRLRFDNEATDRLYEPFYFKAAGELTTDVDQTYLNYGGERAVSIQLNPYFDTDASGGTRMDFDQSARFKQLDQSSFAMASDLKRDTRRARAQSLQPITNKQLLSGGSEGLKEYQVSYFSSDRLNTTDPEAYLSASPSVDLLVDRTSLGRSINESQADQIAGITALHPDGLRYVYGLPAKNYQQQEYLFSVEKAGGNTGCTRNQAIATVNGNGTEIDYKKGTEEYLNVSSVPSYSHAHLLTSVLGADYVDYDDIPGPSDGDYGYWIKFNYVKSDTYKWKTPFLGANYIDGVRNDNGDDKGTLFYGEREQYYLATAETRSHLAVFDLEEREDAKGVSSKFQNTIGEGLGTSSYLLKRIRLFSKAELQRGVSQAIKTVHFEYDYSRCPNVPNNSGASVDLNGDGLNDNLNKGKLTLRKLWFTYDDSNRGRLSPYSFDYASLNPAYNDLHYDRWGCYQKISEALDNTDDCYPIDHPYVFQGNKKNTNDNLADLNASAWHLTDIRLPSGANIEVAYESDDYAYVQDRTAMEMFPIAGFGSFNEDDLNTNSTDNNNNPLNSADLKLYFDLGENQNASFDDFVQDLHRVNVAEENLNGIAGTTLEKDFQIYCKALMELNDNGEMEYVSTYLTVKEDASTGLPEGGLESHNGRKYGWLRLETADLGRPNNLRAYHPLCAAAWQKLKMEHADQIREESFDTRDETSLDEAMGQMLRNASELLAIFKNFYRQCSDREYADAIDLSNSFIRLNTPDKIKKGGGVRVAQITLQDHWDIGEDSNPANDLPTYGQVYEYTTEEDGRQISSGVAINEPSIGGEESALRYAKGWVETTRAKTTENMFFEYPINEAYYPGAGVGYREVKVKSLATHIAQNRSDYPNAELPVGFGTTGMTVHEFYTAKDFPVLVEETLLEKRVGTPRWVPYLVGSTTSERYTGSQGYAIILNDMHGKSKQVTQYGERKDAQGNLVALETINWVKYTYFTDESRVYDSAGKKEVAQVLKNKVPVLLSDDPSVADAQIEERNLGVDYEFFTDIRRTKGSSGAVGLGINTDMTPIVIFGVSFWPSINLNFNDTRLAVTNKIIRKTGILKQTEVFDGQSKVITNNEVFDPLTGEALLTTVNNNFDQLVYNYQVPARLAYDGMGAAYRNWGMIFEGNLSLDDRCGWFRMDINSPVVEGALAPGDECLVVEHCEQVPGLCDSKLFTYLGERNNQHFFENPDSDLALDNASVKMMVVRSGRRNHLSAKVSSITALKDPTTMRDSAAAIVSVDAPLGASNSTTSSSNVNIRTVDSVLSINAVTYSDRWDMGRGECEARTIAKTIEITPPTSELENCLIVDFDLASTTCWPNTHWYIEYSINGAPSITHNRTSVTTLSDTIVCSNYPITVIDYLAFSTLNACIDPVMTPEVVQRNISNPGTYDTINISVPREDYALGQNGVWRPYQNYAYVAEREPGLAGFAAGNQENYDLTSSGVVNEVPLFNWRAPFFLEAEILNVPNWKKTNEISKYGLNGEEAENRDIIGLYSTALYGYNYNVPIGVASNASHYEVAFESFEEYPLFGGFDSPLLNDGHWNFACAPTTKLPTQTYNVVGAYRGGGYLWIDKPYYVGAPLPSQVELRLIGEDGIRYTATEQVSGLDAVSYTGIPFRGDITGVQLINRPGFCELPTDQDYTGTVHFKYCNDCDPADYPQGSSQFYLSGDRAHSGSVSMKIAESGTYTFPQRELYLVKGKTYVVSAWVSRSGDPRATYADGSISLGIQSGGQTTDLPPAGSVIDGWQRIEGLVTYQGNNQDLSLLINADLSGSSDALYLDDLRIYPEDGSLQTYVYEPQDYRLSAVLDENNYATFYHYDEEGNLVVVKKETAKGVKTIQENRAFIIPNIN